MADLELLRLLADGKVHSGASLGRTLGLSRAAVWKRLVSLRALGIEIAAQRGRGYRLARRVDLVDAERLRESLAGVPVTVELHATLGSTSDHLLQAGAPRGAEAAACIAEYQLDGRGRRGRPWLSGFAGGLCLSLARRFDAVPDNLHCLGMVLAVAARGVLARAGGRDVGLKWPNDLVLAGGKLGGLLVDVDGEPAGPLRAVAGIGVNIEPVDALAGDIAAAGGMAPVALAPLAPGWDRTRLAAGLLRAWVGALDRFEREGFAPWAAEWARHDSLAGREVDVIAGNDRIAGTASGIAPDGRLLVRCDGRSRAFAAAEVSVRGAG